MHAATARAANDNTSRRSRRAAPGDARRAVAYLRASTGEQRLSPEAQRASIESWAAREGVELVAWHVDQGAHGDDDSTERPALGAALAALRDEGAGVLVVAKRDRLARDVIVAATVERAAKAAGARVATSDGVANGDTPADQLVRRVVDATAEYELAEIRRRTREALAALRRQGRRAGTVPWGWSADATGRLVPAPREIEAARMAHELRAQGLSVRGIVAALAARGVVGRTGKPLVYRAVYKLVCPLFV